MFRSACGRSPDGRKKGPGACRPQSGRGKTAEKLGESRPLDLTPAPGDDNIMSCKREERKE